MGACTATPADDSWQALRETCMRRGCSEAQMESVLNACRVRRLSAAEAGRLMIPVTSATTESLPADCLFARIEEGLAKNVDVDRIESAVQRRLECLRTAQQIFSDLKPRGNGHGPMGGPPRLIGNMALALESGVDPEVLSSVFGHKGPMRYGRLAHIIDAAESLHLAGLDSDQLRRVMNDFLERNMNRQEMCRVVKVLQKGLGAGKPFEDLYVSMWSVDEIREKE